jgi:hypothetical protein
MTDSWRLRHGKRYSSFVAPVRIGFAFRVRLFFRASLVVSNVKALMYCCFRLQQRSLRHHACREQKIIDGTRIWLMKGDGPRSSVVSCRFLPSRGALFADRCSLLTTRYRCFYNSTIILSPRHVSASLLFLAHPRK